MKKIKFLLLCELLGICFLANAEQIKTDPCDCRFHAHDVVMVTLYDFDPALVGQVGTVLTDCNPDKYHFVDLPQMGGSWAISDDDIGLSRLQ